MTLDERYASCVGMYFLSKLCLVGERLIDRCFFLLKDSISIRDLAIRENNIELLEDVEGFMLEIEATIKENTFVSVK